MNILRPSRLSHLSALATVLVGCVPAAEKVTLSPQAIAIRDKMKIVELEADQSFRVLWLPNYREVYDHQLARYDAVVLSGAIDFRSQTHAADRTVLQEVACGRTRVTTRILGPDCRQAGPRTRQRQPQWHRRVESRMVGPAPIRLADT